MSQNPGELSLEMRVPDAEAHRQSALAAEADQAGDDMDFVEAISEVAGTCDEAGKRITDSEERSRDLIRRMRGRATAGISTDEILALTRE